MTPLEMFNLEFAYYDLGSLRKCLNIAILIIKAI